jgi:hypothetical protein
MPSRSRCPAKGTVHDNAVAETFFETASRPVAVSFLLVNDVALALRISNVVAVGLLFFMGVTFGRP